MKLSEAIDRLEVGETVWVKGKVLDKDTTEQPLYVDFGRVGSLWLYKEHEIYLCEPNSISDEKVLELVSTHFRFDKENFWNQLKEMDMLPQAEKVEVPDCMGKFLDQYPDKDETSMHLIMNDFCESKYFDEFVKLPLADYPMGWDRLMASALMFGYTVKPKLYIVKNCCGEVFSGFYGGYSVSPRFTKEERYYCDFNDKAKAEAVATLVEGQVEEV